MVGDHNATGGPNTSDANAGSNGAGSNIAGNTNHTLTAKGARLRVCYILAIVIKTAWTTFLRNLKEVPMPSAQELRAQTRFDTRMARVNNHNRNIASQVSPTSSTTSSTTTGHDHER
jgi:hypothetical protein